jgi:biopolymer transport protein ExbD
MLIDEYLGPRTFHRHLILREEKKKSRKKALMVSLMLTPLVDAFSILVIFLLQTFSAQPELAMIAKGVTLPSAATGREMTDAPILSISPEEVFLDQKTIGNVQALLKNPTPLMEKLGELRERWMKSHPKETFKGEITLQAHQEISSSVVSQFMSMLPSQHYGLIQLAVLSGKGAAGGNAGQSE